MSTESPINEPSLPQPSTSSRGPALPDQSRIGGGTDSSTSDSERQPGTKSQTNNNLPITKSVFFLLQGMNGEDPIRIDVSGVSSDGNPIWVTLTVADVMRLLSQYLHSKKTQGARSPSGKGFKKFHMPIPPHRLQILHQYEDADGNKQAVADPDRTLAKTCMSVFFENASEQKVGLDGDGEAQCGLLLFGADGEVSEHAHDIGETEQSKSASTFVVNNDETHWANDSEHDRAYNFRKEVRFSSMSTIFGGSGYNLRLVRMPMPAKARFEAKLLSILFDVEDVSDFHREVVRLYSNDDKETALHFAAEYGFTDVVKSMVPDERFDVDTRSNYNQTALCVAAKHGHTEIIEHLLRSGAQINAKNDVHPDDMNIPLTNGHTALHASMYFCLVRTENGYAHLTHGISNYVGNHQSCLGVVKSLLNAKADMKATDNSGCTALHVALRPPEPNENDVHSCELLELLLAVGMDVHAKDNKENTPLHYAARLRSLKKIGCLIDASADVNAKNIDGDTPLHVAARTNLSLRPCLAFGYETPVDFELFMAILCRIRGAGADLDALNNNGKTAMTCAKERLESFLVPIDDGAKRSVYEASGLLLANGTMKQEASMQLQQALALLEYMIRGKPPAELPEPGSSWRKYYVSTAEHKKN